MQAAKERGKAVKFIHNKPLFASQFVECYTGLYYTNTDTFFETRDRLAKNGIGMADGWKLSETDSIPADTYCVLVMFSTEENYTEDEWRIMRIQKKYLARFKRNLKNL